MDQATALRKIVKGKSEEPRRPAEGKDNGNGALSGPEFPKVFAVTSGKGGVGKTNVVGNLAIAFQRMGRRVLIFDADLGLANIDIIFGVHPRYNIESVIRGEKELSQIIVRGPEGVAIIPAGSGVQELAHLTDGHKINLLNEFDLLNSMFDILLIDTGAGISSNVIYFNLAARERIVVVTPEPTSITDAYALMKVMFLQHGVSRFHLLVNMVKNEQEALNVYGSLIKAATRFMREITLDYAGFVPWDGRVQEAVSRREPVSCCYPQAASSLSFEALAGRLLNETDSGPVDGNIKFFWKRLMSEAADGDHEGTDQ